MPTHFVSNVKNHSPAVLLTVLTFGLSITTSQAQPAVTLDDFSGRLINPNIWQEDVSPRRRLTETFMEAQRGQAGGVLYLRGRQYGEFGNKRLRFTDGYFGVELVNDIAKRVDTIEARIRIDSVRLGNCNNGQIQIVSARTTIDGTFVGNRNSTGLRGALRSIVTTNSIDPKPSGMEANEYLVAYEYLRCLEPDCARTKLLGGGVLGKARYGEWIDLSISHNRGARTMAYGMRTDLSEKVDVVAYPDSITQPVAVDNPNISIINGTQVPQCPESITPRPYAEYAVSIDQVRVNPSALRRNQ